MIIIIHIRAVTFKMYQDSVIRIRYTFTNHSWYNVVSPSVLVGTKHHCYYKLAISTLLTEYRYYVMLDLSKYTISAIWFMFELN